MVTLTATLLTGSLSIVLLKMIIIATMKKCEILSP